MKSSVALCLMPLLAAVVLAQGPPGGGPGGGRFGRGFEAGFDGRGPGMPGPNARTTVTGAPYSATETVVRLQTLGDGNQISRKEQTTVYRDSQGRIRTEETVTPPAASGKAAHTVVTIFDPVAGSEFRLDSSTMTARQAGIPKFARAGAAAGAADSQARAQRESAGRPVGSGRPNVTTTDLGTQVINGVSARGTQYTETIPAGAIGNAQAMQVVRITWISTELKVPVEIKSSDPRFGSTDMELTNIAQTEPSASLFVVPAGYTIQQGGRGSDGPRAAGRRGPPLQ